MTRQEQIENIAYNHAIDEVKDTCNPASKRGLFYAGFVEGAEWADAHPRWISVEDDLPKMEHDFDTWSCSKEVLVFTSIGDYCIRRWEYDKRDDRFYWTPRTATVTHWMPIPKPPAKLSNMERTGKEEKNEND